MIKSLKYLVNLTWISANQIGYWAIKLDISSRMVIKLLDECSPGHEEDMGSPDV